MAKNPIAKFCCTCRLTNPAVESSYFPKYKTYLPRDMYCEMFSSHKKKLSRAIQRWDLTNCAKSINSSLTRSWPQPLFCLITKCDLATTIFLIKKEFLDHQALFARLPLHRHRCGCCCPLIATSITIHHGPDSGHFWDDSAKLSERNW